jgi:hypothetical protein
MTDDNPTLDDSEGNPIPDSDLIQKLLLRMPEGEGDIMLSPEGDPVLGLWLELRIDDETGEQHYALNVVVADWTTVVETSNL